MFQKYLQAEKMTNVSMSPGTKQFYKAVVLTVIYVCLVKKKKKKSFLQTSAILKGKKKKEGKEIKEFLSNLWSVGLSSPSSSFCSLYRHQVLDEKVTESLDCPRTREERTSIPY